MIAEGGTRSTTGTSPGQITANSQSPPPVNDHPPDRADLIRHRGPPSCALLRDRGAVPGQEGTGPVDEGGPAAARPQELAEEIFGPDGVHDRGQ